MIEREDIGAVIVTFNPDFPALARLLDSLLSQVGAIVIVDNGSSDDVALWIQEHLPVLCATTVLLGDNFGIAAAQNYGISLLEGRGSKAVVLFDQDSEPAPDMISKLAGAWARQSARGKKVAALGPRYIDERQGNPPPFIQIKGIRVLRQTCSEPESEVEVDYLIASGCLIPMEVLETVGGMREDLFIDYVDIEWGMRARKAGYQSFGVCAAWMKHDLGDEPIVFMGRKLPLHSPVRHYYHFRNAVFLYRLDTLPLQWKVADGWRLILKYGFYTLFAAPRYKHWWMMTKGVWHGIRGRMGRLI